MWRAVRTLLRGSLKQGPLPGRIPALLSGHLRLHESSGSFSRTPGPFVSTVNCIPSQDPGSLSTGDNGILSPCSPQFLSLFYLQNWKKRESQLLRKLELEALRDHLVQPPEFS